MLTIREEVLGLEHTQVAATLNSLALLLKTMGKHEQARSLYERALGIWEKALGHDHPSVALGL